MGIAPDFSDFTSGSPADLAYARQLLTSIHDPEEGKIGQKIIESLTKNGCEIIIEEFPEDSIAAKDKASAAYVPFDDDDPDQIFVHQINILPSNGNASRLLLSLVHEGGAHANAWSNAPALHASPYNTGNPAKLDFVLSPRDWIRAVILTEQDAYAKEKWIAALGAQHDPRLNAPEIQSVHTPQSFQQLRERTGSLHDTLVTIANQSMTARFIGENYRFGHFYVGNALSTYNACNRINEKPEGLIPVRMDLEDILAVGDSFGPNILSDERLFGRGDLSAFIFESGQKQIKQLNEKLGIEDEEALPTLREALAEKGMTPIEFLEQSKTPLPKTHKNLKAIPAWQRAETTQERPQYAFA